MRLYEIYRDQATRKAIGFVVEQGGTAASVFKLAGAFNLKTLEQKPDFYRISFYIDEAEVECQTPDEMKRAVRSGLQQRAVR